MGLICCEMLVGLEAMAILAGTSVVILGSFGAEIQLSFSNVVISWRGD